jgi:hypothetical protein
LTQARQSAEIQFLPTGKRPKLQIPPTSEPVSETQPSHSPHALAWGINAFLEDQKPFQWFPHGVQMIMWLKGAAIPKLEHGVNEKDEF